MPPSVAAQAKQRLCIDCPPPRIPSDARPAPYPGPRCHTHDRAKTAARRASRKQEYQQRQFGLTPARRAEISAAQNDLCAICGPWTGYNGRTRALSTDHDHQCCPGKTSCGKCVRGLLCKHCNDMLGRMRDDPRALIRAAFYLQYPPATHGSLWRRVDGQPSTIDRWVSDALPWRQATHTPEDTP